MGTENLLLGLLAEGASRAAKSLLSAGATLDGCRSKVVELVGTPSESPVDAGFDLTDRARRTLDRADRLSLRLRTTFVEPEHILVSLLDVEGRAGQVLRGLGVDLATLRAAALADTIGHLEPVAEVETTEASPPRCSSCQADLSNEGLAHAVLPSRSAEGRTREFVVVYCNACGAAVGATPVPVRPR